jgi:hypothetical protein
MRNHARSNALTLEVRVDGNGYAVDYSIVGSTKSFLHGVHMSRSLVLELLDER